MTKLPKINMYSFLPKECSQKYQLTPHRLNVVPDDKMSLLEHIEEINQRILFSLGALLGVSALCLIRIEYIVELFQAPALGVKFLQLSPGEYLFVYLKVAFFCGCFIGGPFLALQLILYILPGLSQKERNIILTVSVSSMTLFYGGSWFSYTFLVSVTVKFFILAGSRLIEPLWSFDQYFNFVASLVFSTGIAFLIPIFQLIVGYLGIVSGRKMLSAWKYVLTFTTLLAAIITPSTDPITQAIMAGALFLLYCVGTYLVIWLRNE
jgi:sec-independent protein translocase protein TatC